MIERTDLSKLSLHVKVILLHRSYLILKLVNQGLKFGNLLIKLIIDNFYLTMIILAIDFFEDIFFHCLQPSINVTWWRWHLVLRRCQLSDLPSKMFNLTYHIFQFAIMLIFVKRKSFHFLIHFCPILLIVLSDFIILWHFHFLDFFLDKDLKNFSKLVLFLTNNFWDLLSNLLRKVNFL